MAGAGGFGSALVLRAKEARLRAQAADLLGLMTPLSQGPDRKSVASIQAEPNVHVAPGQPIQPPAQDMHERNPEDRMYGVVEDFLSGLARRP